MFSTQLCLRGLTLLRRKILFTPLLLLATLASASPSQITGTVSNAEGGEPLGKIEVSITNNNSTATTISGPAINLSAITAADGKFHFSGLPPGKYTLEIRGLGYRNMSLPFVVTAVGDAQEFLIQLAPDTFRRKEVVEVHGDIFEPVAWPAVGDLTLTSSELQETSTVLVNDPYRSLQSLPGVSASANNDLMAQFSVMGAPYEQVGVYVDDVSVPNLLHTLPGFSDQASLSLFTGNDVDELQLIPVAYPVRYAEDNGAALAITTRTGTDGAPHFHVTIGLADSEFLGEGGFAASHHGTWLVSARKSYVGYLEQFFNSTSFSEVGLYDADVKLTYDLTPAHSFSLFATGGQTHVRDPSLPPTSDPSFLKTGSNDLGIGRLGWRWQINPKMQLETRAAYVRSGYVQSNPAGLLLESSLDREWSTGSIFSWSWNKGGILQAGYSIRWPQENDQENFFIGAGQSPMYGTEQFTYRAQNAFAQFSQQFWNERLRLQGGLRWAQEGTVRIQPITGQASLSYRLLRNTDLQASWGKYDQFLASGGGFCTSSISGPICQVPLPYASTQYLVAAERRIGTRTRLRVEAFDRQNTSRADFYAFTPSVLLARSMVAGRDYSRGLQFILQRRSENRLSGWIGYTLVYAQQRDLANSVPQIPVPLSIATPYFPTLVDQRNNVNLVASYRVSPTIRLSAKNLYGSGFVIDGYPPPVIRLSPYERLDLRADKSWLFDKWKLTLYAELLNVTNHYNPVFLGYDFLNTSGNAAPTYAQTVPITPTIGLGFDF
jgi:carboxypeptidase family protein